MTNIGWRKPTPGLAKAEQHAQVGERLAVPKAQAIGALKKVAAAIGLKAPDMLLLDTLAAVTQPQDWEEGRRPIVWASNAFLTEQIGYSLAALRRHIRRLCELGIISMKDSPNGKRWGRRDDCGYIVEAYGFDLAPLAARAEEFEALYAGILEERALCKSLRNTITVARRAIRAKIEKAQESALRGPWKDLTEEFTMALQSLPKRSDHADKLMDLVDCFLALKEKVEEAFSMAFDCPEDSDKQSSQEPMGTDLRKSLFSQNMIPMGIKNETHIQTTNKLDFVNSKCSANRATVKSAQDPNPIKELEDAKFDLDGIEWTTRQRKNKTTEVELSTIMAACPEFADLARGFFGGYVKNWDDMHRAAGLLRPMVGISEDAWNIAQQKLGPFVAAATIALIYDKSAKGEVISAGGYLRGIVGKACAGQLHLERSFYGRLNQSLRV